MNVITLKYNTFVTLPYIKGLSETVRRILKDSGAIGHEDCVSPTEHPSQSSQSTCSSKGPSADGLAQGSCLLDTVWWMPQSLCRTDWKDPEALIDWALPCPPHRWCCLISCCRACSVYWPSCGPVTVRGYWQPTFFRHTLFVGELTHPAPPRDPQQRERYPSWGVHSAFGSLVNLHACDAVEAHSCVDPLI